MILENVIAETWHINLADNFDIKAGRVTETRNKVVITDRMWARLLSSTNQPCFLSPQAIEEAKQAKNLQKWRSKSGKYTIDGHRVMSGDDGTEENSPCVTCGN